MSFQIRVEPGGQIFDSNEDETILDAAQRAGVLLPYSCGNGQCGVCRGKVLAGDIEHGAASPVVLPATDRERNFALFCCARARSDLHIDIRRPASAATIPIRTLPVRVEQLTLATPDVMILELKLPGSEQFQYHAGQYVDILLSGGKRRAFSFATAPNTGNHLQLHIRHVPGGQFTGHVFSDMKLREMLRIHGPHGNCYLREDSDKPILLIAGGTGFAPIKAIVEYALAQNLTRPMHVYWGGKHRADLYMNDLASNWQKTHSHIHYVPVLSDADTEDHWEGRTGFVHQAAMADFPDLSGHQVYVCGSPAMVNAARQDFIGQCNLPENEFIADSFEFSRDAP